ncbi:MAG: DUF2953 domain-containing protein [Limnochordia bacterium]
MVVALVAALFVLIVLIPIRLETRFKISEARVRFDLRFSVAGLIKWRVNVPLGRLGRGLVRARVRLSPGNQTARVTDELKPGLLSRQRRTDKSLIQRILSGVDVVHMFFGSGPQDNAALGSVWLRLIVVPFRIISPHFRCLEFSWQTRIGVGDAGATAVLTGVLWALKCGILAHLDRRLILVRRPYVDVKPSFGEAELDTELFCIFQLSVGQIMWRTLRDAAQRWQRKEAGIYGG